MNSWLFRCWVSLTLLALVLAPAGVRADGWVTMWGSGGDFPGYFDPTPEWNTIRTNDRLWS